MLFLLTIVKSHSKEGASKKLLTNVISVKLFLDKNLIWIDKTLRYKGTLGCGGDLVAKLINPFWMMACQKERKMTKKIQNFKVI